MALPTSFYGATVADNTVKSNGSPETASWQVPITTITAANFDAVATACAALLTAVGGLTIGNTIKHETSAARIETAKTPATDPLAQRENKWLARYHDATNSQIFRVSFPCADLSKHMDNSEFVDLTAGEGLALKTAFEAVVKSPNDASHAVVLDSVQFVGRQS